MVFTLSSGTQNPSSAYTTVGGGPGGINTVAAGTSPHTSFAPIYFGQSRWGDYSFVAPDPSGTGTWLATEYIPPLANQDPVDNWGTSVFELSQ
jgi:hypothetical protein